MAVRFNHGLAEWPSFTAFLAYRRRLAALIGIDLDSMEGFGGSGRWSKVTDDLQPFLSMADATGTLRIKDCRRVALRLSALAPQLEGDDRARTLALAEGLVEAARARERFRFRR